MVWHSPESASAIRQTQAAGQGFESLEFPMGPARSRRSSNTVATAALAYDILGLRFEYG